MFKDYGVCKKVNEKNNTIECTEERRVAIIDVITDFICYSEPIKIEIDGFKLGIAGLNLFLYTPDIALRKRSSTLKDVTADINEYLSKEGNSEKQNHIKATKALYANGFTALVDRGYPQFTTKQLFRFGAVLNAINLLNKQVEIAKPSVLKKTTVSSNSVVKTQLLLFNNNFIATEINFGLLRGSEVSYVVGYFDGTTKKVSAQLYVDKKTSSPCLLLCGKKAFIVKIADGLVLPQNILAKAKIK